MNGVDDGLYCVFSRNFSLEVRVFDSRKCMGTVTQAVFPVVLFATAPVFDRRNQRPGCAGIDRYLQHACTGCDQGNERHNITYAFPLYQFPDTARVRHGLFEGHISEYGRDREDVNLWVR